MELILLLLAGFLSLAEGQSDWRFLIMPIYIYIHIYSYSLRLMLLTLAIICLTTLMIHNFKISL